MAIGGAAAWTYAARARGRVRALMNRILHMQAENAAYKISQSIQEIESQVGWTLQLPLTDATLDQHRFDGMRLLHQSAAITDVVQIDSTGKERLHLNRGQATLIPNDQDYVRIEMASCYRLYFLPIDFDMNRHPQYPICENFKATDVRGLQRKSRPGLHFIPSPHSSGDSLKDIFPLRGAVGPDDDIAVPPRR